MKGEKILHIVTVSFAINHFFGQQFVFLKKTNNNEYHLGCSPSLEFRALANKLKYIPLEVEITRSISPIKDLRAIFTVYRYIKKNRITKVVGHTPKGGMVAMIASFFAGVSEPIYFRHGIIYETSTGFKRVLLKNIERLSGYLATKVVCVSQSVLDISIKDKLNKSSKNLILGLGTCNGIDTEEKFNPKKISLDAIEILRSELSINKKDKIVGYVGRLVKDKGIDDLISAWEIIEMRYPDSKLLLVGPIEARDSISDYSKNKISKNSSIIFTDFVVDTSTYFSLMHVFVLPTYREGFPTVALEASSMNLPVIITKATGCTEAILENETGLFISNNPKDIANKIIFYLENKEIAIKHGFQGRLFVQENFEQTKIWKLISKILEL
ncbi:glycosyltransferase family 4 protein [Flavobacterium xueshanense]|uniref:Glycosyl transferases group 1 n=1 Tax=Flavobacterium xueshanense TaxID=935223 RepID=A0A1I2CIX0_9FLAO|nr:glycosyltransferase family 4 protein [Flavobacterium xueshanense]SFE68297.1 Glycosyl transferases group 1 [Flavobacterium xueshanense]